MSQNSRILQSWNVLKPPQLCLLSGRGRNAFNFFQVVHLFNELYSTLFDHKMKSDFKNSSKEAINPHLKHKIRRCCICSLSIFFFTIFFRLLKNCWVKYHVDFVALKRNQFTGIQHSCNCHELSSIKSSYSELLKFTHEQAACPVRITRRHPPTVRLIPFLVLSYNAIFRVKTALFWNTGWDTKKSLLFRFPTRMKQSKLLFLPSN